jgi:hypothetical protein
MIFLTDRFHTVCHKCSPEYKFCAHELLERVNTSAQEQINSLMMPLDKMLRSSNLENGMLIVDVWTKEHNKNMIAEVLKMQRQ